MTSLIYTAETKTYELPSINWPKASLTSGGMSRAIKGMSVALYAAFVPMFYTYFISRVLGLNALCYQDLSTQAASVGLALLPFSMYCIARASRHSLRAVFATSAVVSAALGIVFAAIV